MSHELQDSFQRCANLFEHADGLLITAGAGMGVDSGLPDFRGPEGFWRAYPALGQRGIGFSQIANPAAFRDDPTLAWGFYGHRLNLYRGTRPHEGFKILRKIADLLPQGAFIFTSNVDGQFQLSGFRENQVCEYHGSIHHMQCENGCMADIWSAAEFNPIVDEAQCRLISELPRCPYCGDVARPNILMFSDWNWLNYRKEMQEARLKGWRRRVLRPVIIEIGAGSQIPSVREFNQMQDCPVIRINPTEPELRSLRGVSLPMGGLEGLNGIAHSLKQTGFFS